MVTSLTMSRYWRAIYKIQINVPNLLKRKSVEAEVYIFTKDEPLDTLRPLIAKRTFHYLKDVFPFATQLRNRRILGKNQDGKRFSAEQRI